MRDLFLEPFKRGFHPGNFLYAFVPWAVFLSQGASAIPDLARARVAIGADCRQPRKIFTATVAKSDESRARGLGGRAKPMASDEAMLFVFSPPQSVAFWMKDTLIPLELVFFDASGRYLEKYEMPVEKDPTNPKGQYASKSAVSAALEVAPHGLNYISNRNYKLCIETFPGT